MRNLNCILFIYFIINWQTDADSSQLRRKEEPSSKIFKKFSTKKTRIAKFTKYKLNTKPFIKQLFPNVDDLDPTVDMSYFDPLKLKVNQTAMLQNLKSGVCWKRSYTRGSGNPVTYCDPETDKDGSLCYPKCEEGYTGLGPVCWEKCKPGYTDRGAFCIIDLDIYNKGCCCAIDDECCNNCNATYVDDGCTCRRPPKSYSKKSYGRGAGEPLGCKPGEELNGLLCYSKCNSTYTGEGPVCWQNCKSSYPSECGAVCAVNSLNCIIKAAYSVAIVFPPGNVIFAYESLLWFIYLQYIDDIPLPYLFNSCPF